MVKKASASSYQKVQDAKKRSRARVDAARATGILPPPPPYNLGTSSHPIIVSSSSTISLPSPPPPSRPSPELEKKRKTSGSSFGVTFDGPQFVWNHIFFHSSINMDDAMVRNHLNVIVQGSVRAAGI
ncbi:uncharacterized protein DS421_16g547000 [Arachis hypogaea]|nr:uncharacterized protein DS421_16g547000 [Arachis hypogaea]